MGRQSVSDKRGGWAAVVFAVLTVVALFLVAAPPGIDATASEVRDYLLDNRSGALAQLLVYSLTLPCFIVFVGALRQRLSADPELSGVAAVASVAGGLFYLSAIIGTAMFFAPVWNEDTAASISGESMLVVWNIGYLLYLVVFPTAALFLAGVAWCAHRSGAMPKWYAVVTGVVAALQLLSVVGVMNPGVANASFIVFVALVAWTLLTGVLLLRGSASVAGT